MERLWDKGEVLDSLVEGFTVGDDHLLDQNLVYYDCLGSMAHAAMLHKIGILTDQELDELLLGLEGVVEGFEKGDFVISRIQEDVHTAVENFLTESLGDVGRKLHTSRSRNDQVLVDLRLYAKDHLHCFFGELLNLISEFTHFAEVYAQVPIPGRTHMQRAMPSSLGLWAGAMAESLLDSLEVLWGAYELNDQSPLGSAASYGSCLPIDRAYTAELLGFSRVQNNVLYANNSRGKIEAVVVHGLSQVMGDLSKAASDLIFFSLPEVGYLTLSSQLCLGSSLMPQKRNPCVLELIRGKAASVMGYLFQLLEITRGLPSGYHRDFQETKRPFLQSFEVSRGAVAVMTRMLEGIEVHEDVCKDSFSSELFATDHVLQLTEKGVPFRDAYRLVAKKLDEVPMQDPVENITKKQHLGAPGNLGLELVRERIEKNQKKLSGQKKQWVEAVSKLKKINKKGVSDE